MDITREYLESEIENVREQGAAAANLVQQAAGAELALQSVIAALEAEEQEKDHAEE